MAADETKRTVSVEQAARILGIGRTSAYEAAHAGEIPSLRIGKRIVVPKVRLLALLGETAEAKVEPDGGADA